MFRLRQLAAGMVIALASGLTTPAAAQETPPTGPPSTLPPPTSTDPQRPPTAEPHAHDRGGGPGGVFGPNCDNTKPFGYGIADRLPTFWGNIDVGNLVLGDLPDAFTGVLPEADTVGPGSTNPEEAEGWAVWEPDTGQNSPARNRQVWASGYTDYRTKTGLVRGGVTLGTTAGTGPYYGSRAPQLRGGFGYYDIRPSPGHSSSNYNYDLSTAKSKTRTRQEFLQKVTGRTEAELSTSRGTTLSNSSPNRTWLGQAGTNISSPATSTWALVQYQPQTDRSKPPTVVGYWNFTQVSFWPRLGFLFRDRDLTTDGATTPNVWATDVFGTNNTAQALFLTNGTFTSSARVAGANPNWKPGITDFWTDDNGAVTQISGPGTGPTDYWYAVFHNPTTDETATATLPGQGTGTAQFSRRNPALGNILPVTAAFLQGFDRLAAQAIGGRAVNVISLGDYVCRKIAGSNNYSQHAWGNAVDLGVDLDGNKRWSGGNSGGDSIVGNGSPARNGRTVLRNLYNLLYASMDDPVVTTASDGEEIVRDRNPQAGRWKIRIFIFDKDYDGSTPAVTTGHDDHIHLEFWPKQTGIPPCDGGPDAVIPTQDPNDPDAPPVQMDDDPIAGSTGTFDRTFPISSNAYTPGGSLLGDFGNQLRSIFIPDNERLRELFIGSIRSSDASGESGQQGEGYFQAFIRNVFLQMTNADEPVLHIQLYLLRRFELGDGEVLTVPDRIGGVTLIEPPDSAMVTLDTLYAWIQTLTGPERAVWDDAFVLHITPQFGPRDATFYDLGLQSIQIYAPVDTSPFVTLDGQRGWCVDGAVLSAFGFRGVVRLFALIFLVWGWWRTMGKKLWSGLTRN